MDTFPIRLALHFDSGAKIPDGFRAANIKLAAEVCPRLPSASLVFLSVERVNGVANSLDALSHHTLHDDLSRVMPHFTTQETTTYTSNAHLNDKTADMSTNCIRHAEVVMPRDETFNRSSIYSRSFLPVPHASSSVCRLSRVSTGFSYSSRKAQRYKRRSVASRCCFDERLDQTFGNMQDAASACVHAYHPHADFLSTSLPFCRNLDQRWIREAHEIRTRCPFAWPDSKFQPHARQAQGARKERVTSQPTGTRLSTRRTEHRSDSIAGMPCAISLNHGRVPRYALVIEFEESPARASCRGVRCRAAWVFCMRGAFDCRIGVQRHSVPWALNGPRAHGCFWG